MVSGGLFDRAEGLWQEMEADLYAATPLDALEMASNETPVVEGEQRTINRRRRRKRAVREQVPVQV